ncbi:MAG: peptide ABC transporter substrate-binding protein [Bacilli bacterium]
MVRFNGKNSVAKHRSDAHEGSSSLLTLRKAGILLAVTAASAALLVSHQGAAPSTVSAAAPAVHRGGTIVDALGPLVDINWYLPLRPVAYNSLYDAWAASLMYKGLFHVGPNAKIDYARSIASSVRWNPQGTVYTVTLNPKWHWSNGSPVTASDVAFTWKLIQAASASNAPAPWPYAGADTGGVPTDIKSFTVLNPHAFQVVLKAPVNQMWFLYNGLADFMPLPELAWNKYPKNIDQELSYLAANGNNASFFKVIDGPFRLVSAVQNQSWTFVPNYRYDGHKPSINQFVFMGETSDTAEVNALKTGTVQVGYLPSYMYSSRGQLTNDRLFTNYSFTIDRSVLNFKSPTVGAILRQLPVREALQMGIDQYGIIKDLYNGLGVPGTGPVPLHPSTFVAPSLKSPLYAFNPAAGKKLLEKNGWHEANGVMVNSHGQSLSFNVQYPAGNTTTQAMVQLLQQDWANEGIQVKLSPVPFASMLQYHHQPTKWDIQTGLGWSYGGSYPTGGGMYSSTGGYNFYGYRNATIDKLIAATHQPHATAAQSQQALNAYQLFAARQLPNLWMPVPMGLGEVAKNVHGVVRSSNPFTNALSPQYWWVG